MPLGRKHQGQSNAGERQSLLPPVSVCFSLDIKSTPHVCFPSSPLPGRAVSAVCVFKCHSDPDLEQAGGHPGSGFASGCLCSQLGTAEMERNQSLICSDPYTGIRVTITLELGH